MKKLACVAVAFSMLLGFSASAATLSVSGGTGGTLPGGFDPIGWSNPDGIGQGSNITIFTSANAAAGGLFVTPATSIQLTFTYMGTEAGNTNFSDSQLSWDNTALFNNKVTPVGTSVISTHANLGSGLIPLLFRTLAEHTGGIVATAANGGPIAAALSIAYSEILFGNTVYAFFGDGLGDSDRDDMVVKITATVVPLPAAGLLFPTALALLGYFGWRRNRRAAIA